MAKIRIISNKKRLVLGILFGFLFTAIGIVGLCNGQFGLIIHFGIGLLVFIICIKGYIELLKKGKIKKNKESMKKIKAKVTGFETQDTHQKTPSNYYFKASNGIDIYNSEEFNAHLTGSCGVIEERLKLMQIPYNPKNPKDSIKALDDRLKTIEMGIQQHDGLQTKILMAAHAATQQIKERLESGEVPYITFKGHKLSVGDQVDVYIDPKDSKNYRIDTDFLYC